jgi:hypothetical protein
MAIGFAFWPGWGWIAMSVLAAQADSLMKAHTSLVAQIDKMRTENAETLRIVQQVGVMIEQCLDVEGKMGTAIKAMEDLSELFGNHATCYDKIALYLGGMNLGVKSDSAVNRRVFVTKNLDKAVEYLKDVSWFSYPSLLIWIIAIELG